MSNLRPELHVAQQSRRDRLRIQQGSCQLETYPNNLELIQVHPVQNPDLVQVRDVRNANLLYDPTLFPSGIINFSSNSNVLPSEEDTVQQSELGDNQPGRHMPAEVASMPNLPILSNLNASSRAAGDPQVCGSNWKGFEPQQNCGWTVNYASGSADREGNQNQMFVGEVFSNNMMVNNVSASSIHYLKSNQNGYQDVQSNLTNPSSEISSQNSQKHYGDIHFNSSPNYQNALHGVLSSSSVGSRGLGIAALVQQNIRETGQGSWADSGNELVFLPTYEDQSNVIRFDSAGAWMNRPVEGCHQWSGEPGFVARTSNEEMRTAAADAATQGLALSLSSNPPSKMCVDQLGEGISSEGLHSRTDVFKEPLISESVKSLYSRQMQKPSIVVKGCGRSLQEIVGTSAYTVHRSSGPLGPFTGYATILKSSRFLKPTQELLDEVCGASGSNLVNTCRVPERISEEASASASASANAASEVDAVVGIKGNDNSGVSSSTFYSSNQTIGDGGVGSSSSECLKPEYQQKKAKLLYLQEEVCRRYKQYHQQMQMVVSSFESVAGLSAATPYVSLILRTVSRSFRSLKNAISDQLKHVMKALGEDLLSPTTGASSSKGDMKVSKFKYMDQSFLKHKSGGPNVGFHDPQQHVWRPQRGLPERAVAVLRAWLFEHFLHPYPTDTDKHMLATQTGLSRNQVSNWFINARVRIWKPMVEEIHTLETKGCAESNQNSTGNDGKSTGESASRLNMDQHMSKMVGSNASSHRQLDGMVDPRGGLTEDQCNQEKRSRVECQVPARIGGSVMSFLPYQRSGLEMGGLGAVSLTLGLRHGVEGAQQQQQPLQQLDDQRRQQVGGPMIHDFVG